MDMRLFPNPAVDELNYVIGYGRVVEADLTIYDVLGVIVRQEKLEIRRHPKRHILRLDAWQAGIYFFKLSVEGEEIIERVVVQ